MMFTTTPLHDCAGFMGNYQRRLPTTASSATSGDLPLLRVAAFLDNFLEAARWFKLVAPSAPPRLTLVAADLQQLRRISC
jgi:hypothetical protein